MGLSLPPILLFLVALVFWFDRYEQFIFFSCCCGRSKDAHGAPIRESEIKQNIVVKWDIEKHTKDEGTNAYGDIQFHGAGKKTRAKVTHKIL